jgi:hypothetical protein
MSETASLKTPSASTLALSPPAFDRFPASALTVQLSAVADSPLPFSA